MKNKQFLYDLCWLTLLITTVFFIFLGIPALSPPDEPRYAEIPREMLFFHQFIIPHLNGLMYFEKPPLSYWCVAGFMKLFGDSEWAVRASVAVMGVLGCLATYAISQKLFNRRTGILSALILSSSLLYFLMSHLNTTDMSVSFCLTLSLYSFLLALQNKIRPTSAWLWSGYLFAGLAMMAKGLIGIAFPGMILLIWIAVTKNWKMILKMRIITGVLIILAVNLPWLIAAEKQVPDFLHYYFIVQQIERYATPIEHRHMNIFAYAAVVLFSVFPWTFFLPKLLQYQLQQFKTTFAQKNNFLFLLLWPAFIILFFAFSDSILIPYVLPITPPLAILFAHYFDTRFTASFKKYFIILLAGTYLIFSVVWVSWGHFNKRSIKPLALRINILKVQHPNAKIMNYGFYLQDLPFYTKQIVTVVGTLKNNDFNELTYGILHDPNSQTWMISYPDFWKQWNGNQRVYAVFDLRNYNDFVKHSQHKIYIIQKTSMFGLITNKDPA